MSFAEDLLEYLEGTLATSRPVNEQLQHLQDRLVHACPDVARLAHVVVRLYDPSLDPAWLPELNPPTELLLTRVAGRWGAPPAVRAALIRALAPLHAQLPVSRQRLPALSHADTPLAGFHLSMYRHALRPDATRVYLAVAHVVHLQARALERHMLPRRDEFGDKLDRNLYEHLLSARVLCMYAPRRFRDLSPEQLIDAALKAYQAAAGAGSGMAPRTVEKHRLHLHRLLGLRESDITPLSPPLCRVAPADGHRVRVVHLDDADLVDTAGAESEPPPRVVNIYAVVREPPQEALAEGETDMDYLAGVQESEPSAPITSPPTDWWRRWWSAQAAAASRLGYIHAPSTVQLFEYADLYEGDLARPPEAMDLEESARATWVLLSLYYGLSPTVLDALQVAPGLPVDSRAPALNPDTWTFYLPLPRVGYASMSPVLEAACWPGADWLQIPLLPWVRRTATRYRRALEDEGRWPPQPFWAYSDAYTPARPMSWWWNRLCAGQHRPPLTAARLARSAGRWARHLGMPAVFAAMLSSRFDFTTLATSAYVNVTAGQLVEAHAETAAALHGRILAELRHRYPGVPLGHLEDPTLFMPPTTDEQRFGSRVVPRVEIVRRSLEALRSRLRPLDVSCPISELIRRFNVLSIWTWMRLRWAAALRPYRDPSGALYADAPGGGWILVEDKDSPRGAERRLVPLPRGETRRLLAFREAGIWLRQCLRQNSGIALTNLPDDALFFVIDRERRRAVPLTPPGIRAGLAEEGLAELCPWRLNGPRHYWLTRALKERVFLSALEPFLGHLHDHLPWSPWAVASLEAAAETFRTFAVKILREVGFDDAD